MSNIEIIRKVSEYKKIQAYIQQLQDEADALKTEITAEMEAQNTDTLKADVYTVHYTPYTATRLDSAALKKELPDIAARYSKISEVRRFTVA